MKTDTLPKAQCILSFDLLSCRMHCCEKAVSFQILFLGPCFSLALSSIRSSYQSYSLLWLLMCFRSWGRNVYSCLNLVPFHGKYGSVLLNKVVGPLQKPKWMCTEKWGGEEEGQRSRPVATAWLSSHCSNNFSCLPVSSPQDYLIRTLIFNTWWNSCYSGSFVLLRVCLSDIHIVPAGIGSVFNSVLQCCLYWNH